MTERVEIALDWREAFVPGAYDAPEDAALLHVPAVYAALAQYDAAAVVYIGQSMDFLARLRSHLVATLGLTYWLRDETGAWAYEPPDEHGFLEMMAPEALAGLQRLAHETVTRTCWFMAELVPEALRPVEALLIREVRQCVGDGTRIGGKPVICDNGNAGMVLSEPFVVENGGAAEMVELLGTRLAWPREEAA